MRPYLGDWDVDAVSPVCPHSLARDRSSRPPRQVISFDDYGVSGHANHRALSDALRYVCIYKLRRTALTARRGAARSQLPTLRSHPFIPSHPPVSSPNSRRSPCFHWQSCEDCSRQPPTRMPCSSTRSTSTVQHVGRSKRMLARPFGSDPSLSVSAGTCGTCNYDGCGEGNPFLAAPRSCSGHHDAMSHGDTRPVRLDYNALQGVAIGQRAR